MVYYIHIKLLLAKHFNFYEGKDNKTKCAKTTLCLVSMNIIGEDILTPFSPFAYEPAFLSLAVSDVHKSSICKTIRFYETYLTQYKIMIVPRHITATMTPPINDPTAIPAVADDCSD